MKNEKGFTLVELIAVIVLLALIALLITPKITETLKKQKLEIFRDSVEGIVDTVKKDAVSNAGISTGMSSYRAYTFNENSLQLDVADYDNPEKKIMLSGSIKNGTGDIIVSNVSDISLAITNGKYCATKTATERDITVIEMQDGDTCNILDTSIESGTSCFIYNENPDGTLTITGYDFANSKNCGSNIIIPNKINKKVVSAIEEGAFFDYNEERYILMANYMYYVKDALGNIIDEYWISDYSELVPEDAEINYYYFTRVSSMNEKYCYNILNDVEVEVELDYQKNSSDGYDFCTIDSDYYELSNDNTITRIDFSKNHNIKKIPNLLAPGSKISSIDLGSTITEIGVSSFSSNLITSLNITSSVVEISNYSFYDNLITTVDFENSQNLEEIGTGAFYLNAIETVDISQAEKMKIISTGAFQENNITNIAFSTSLEEIGDYAFEYNRLFEFNFNNLSNLKRIGSYAFNNNLPNNTTIDFSKCVSLEEIGDYAFWSTYINNVNFGSIPLKSIGAGAFGHNKINEMEKIDLSGLSNLKTIGSKAFMNASSIVNKQFILPNGITSFGTRSLGVHPVPNYIYMLKGVNDSNNLSNFLASEYNTYIMFEDDDYYIFTHDILVNDKNILLSNYDSNIRIVQGGEYNISGSFEHSIIIDSLEKVTLNLNNVIINSKTTAAIANINSGELLINLPTGTTNTLKDAGTTENDGCIYSDGKLVFSGDGTLYVYGNQQEGISTTDNDITINGGNIYIYSLDDGINAGGEIGGVIQINGGNLYGRGKWRRYRF